MSLQIRIANEVDHDGKWLYRVSGISAIVFGMAYIVIIALYIPVGRPTGAEAWLISLAGNTTRWWAIIGLSVLTDFLLAPVALALYLALKSINKNAMLLATIFVGLFIFLDLTLTWTNIASLISLSGNYTAATDDTQRAVFITAALYPSSVVESNLLFIYNSLTLAVGILIAALIMLKGIFSRSTAYVGLLTGILGIISVTSSFFSSSLSSITIILASLLTTVWIFLVGFGLSKLGT